MVTTEVPKLVGARVKRREDPRLITGNATYVDDIQLVRMLHASIVRSELAHARITAVNVEAAKSMPGVLLVLTGDDIKDLVPSLPAAPATPDTNMPAHPPLAVGKVRHVGDGIAMVIAADRYQARDAA